MWMITGLATSQKLEKQNSVTDPNIPILNALEIPGQEKWIISSTKKFQSGL